MGSRGDTVAPPPRRRRRRIEDIQSIRSGELHFEHQGRYGSECEVLDRAWQRQKLRDFLTQHCLSSIRSDVVDEMDVSRHYGVTVRAPDLIEFHSVLAYLIFHHPQEMMPVFDAALRDVQRTIVDAQAESAPGSEGCLKENSHVRIISLPPTREHLKQSISSIRSLDSFRLIVVGGTVVRAGKAKMLEMKRTYKCLSCGESHEVDCDMAKGNTISPPVKCSNMDCNHPAYQEVDSYRELHDYQEVKIQEPAQGLDVGCIPRSITMILLDDLVDTCKPGDDVEVTCSILRRWQPVSTEVKCVIEMTLLVNSVVISSGTDAQDSSVSNELRDEFAAVWQDNSTRPLAVRNLIVASVCPQIYGLFSVKLAILMSLIGGGSFGDHGMKKRDVCHLLLLGDPGCGKSQFLRFAAKLSPRSVLTTGIGTTGAGLTCSAVKDEGGEWMLEAGALVLADRGLCCIDEFGSMKKEELTAIHEAMEQQTLTVTKAGINRTLNARTTVFAVANPKGSYDLDMDVTENTDIQSPLLSRFDLILLILDTKNAEWDEVISSFVLQAATGAAPLRAPCPQTRRPISTQPWTVDKVQKYIAWVREQHPAVGLSDDAKTVLEAYYRAQRQSENRSASRTTVRLLESLIRLTQAHARLMCRSTATLQDAVVSVICMETSVAATSLLSLQSALHSDFPEDPDHEFNVIERMILASLGLQQLQPASGSHGLSDD